MTLLIVPLCMFWYSFCFLLNEQFLLGLLLFCCCCSNSSVQSFGVVPSNVGYGDGGGGCGISSSTTIINFRILSTRKNYRLKSRRKERKTFLLHLSDNDSFGFPNRIIDYDGTRTKNIPTTINATNLTATIPNADIQNTIPATTTTTVTATFMSQDVKIQNPVLQKMYPKMILYKATYGHPNIPLPEGKLLDAIRRLHIQEKLIESDVQLLNQIGFRFHSLEDVYNYAPFEELFHQLVQYKELNNGDVSPPKKYKYNPELGAWVTSIRRIGPDNIDKEHREKLNEIQFQWVSPRKCGSSFMKQYRLIQQRIQEKEQAKHNVTTTKETDTTTTIAASNTTTSTTATTNVSTNNIFLDDDDEDILKWIVAMQKTNLSETRQHYMTTLLGDDWKSRYSFEK